MIEMRVYDPMNIIFFLFVISNFSKRLVSINIGGLPIVMCLGILLFYFAMAHVIFFHTDSTIRLVLFVSVFLYGYVVTNCCKAFSKKLNIIFIIK
jgi:predicted tellurium resistance membrane protein TerC